LTVNKHRKL